MPYDPPPDLTGLSLADIAQWSAAQRLPPVETWTPAQTGESHMRIAADGRWYHEGGEIRRPAMVRAFASLLLRDAAGQHWLITPHERLAIAVDDAAFIATDVKREGDALVFRLNTDEFVLAGPEHPLIARGTAEAPALYLAVRHGCEARLNRSTWAQLAEIAIAEATASSDSIDAEATADGDSLDAEAQADGDTWSADPAAAPSNPPPAAEPDPASLTIASRGARFALTPA